MVNTEILWIQKDRFVFELVDLPSLILNWVDLTIWPTQSYPQAAAAGGVSCSTPEEELLTFRNLSISGYLNSFTNASRRSSVQWCGSFLWALRTHAGPSMAFS
jgi:hypothetical protein